MKGTFIAALFLPCACRCGCRPRRGFNEVAEAGEVRFGSSSRDRRGYWQQGARPREY